jgi:UPF0755 protein
MQHNIISFQNIKYIIYISLAIALFGCVYFYYSLTKQVIPKDKYMIINSNQSGDRTCKQISELDPNYNEMVCKIYIRLKSINFKAGEYDFHQSLSLRELIRKLNNNQIIIRMLTISEGLTNKQIYKIIDDNPYLTGNIDINYVEGSFLPQTYSYKMGDDKNKIIIRLAEAQSDLFNNLSIAQEDRKKLLTLASIIEKEAKINSERPLIASVYYNRLQIGMPLQADPTIIYDIKNGENFNYKLTGKDIKQNNSPYNSYKFRNLPPTPICNPGLNSIIAAINPAQTDYIYFVIDGKSGGHSFSANYSDHVLNIKRNKR